MVSALILKIFLNTCKYKKAFNDLIKTPAEATENTTWLQDVLKKHENEQKKEADEHEKFMQNWNTKFYSQKRQK